MAAEAIPFIDLRAQRLRIANRIEAAIRRVLEHGQYILGPEVVELEQKLAAFVGARHCVTCANGTDALTLVLMAEGIGPGDAVFVPAFTFAATAEAACLVGATPVFCDVVEETFNLDPDSLAETVPHAGALGLKPRMVIPVDLFGRPADYRRIMPAAERFGLTVLADAAQSMGASIDGHRVGTFGTATATSFFPAKPLGCYGDGGAVFTDDDDLAGVLRSLRLHGKGTDKYDNVRVGMNSRLDTIQAAVLLEKLEIFEDEIAARQRVAERYAEGLRGLKVPPILDDALSAWAQYVLRVPDRNAIAARLRSMGIPTAIHYPTPLTVMPSYRNFPTSPGGTPASERLSREVLSLPMHPYLDSKTQDLIVDGVLDRKSIPSF